MKHLQNSLSQNCSQIMSRLLKFNIEPSESQAEMVDVNLNDSSEPSEEATTVATLDLGRLITAPLHRGYPYGYSEEDMDGTPCEADFYFCKKANSTGQLAEKVSTKEAPSSLSMPSTNSISCLRQMYCPECHERLHEQEVRLERLLTLCCFALLPLYPCCMKRNSDECKVVCGKCGYTLGAWKRQ